jgi:ubiquitin-conjugating enzyme E2 I|tara:strand:- start:703 stop:852 length:150 start_codon:yes stop_codon:yes gene_type:complete
VKQILIGIQDLLDTPNINDPANSTANQLYKTNKSAYNQKIKQEAKKQST